MTSEQEFVAVLRFPHNDREDLRIGLDTGRGSAMCELRIYTRFGDQAAPSKKGLVFGANRIPEVIAALQTAHEQALALAGGGA